MSHEALRTAWAHVLADAVRRRRAFGRPPVARWMRLLHQSLPRAAFNDAAQAYNQAIRQVPGIADGVCSVFARRHNHRLAEVG